MTDAERSPSRRKQLGIVGSPWYAAARPWDQGRADFHETRTLDSLDTWLEHGDAEHVAKWLAERILDRDDYATFLDEVRTRMDSP